MNISTSKIATITLTSRKDIVLLRHLIEMGIEYAGGTKAEYKIDEMACELGEQLTKELHGLFPEEEWKFSILSEDVW